MAFRVRALHKGELDGFLTCFQAAFGVDDQSLATVRNSLVNDPYFHPERVRVGLVDGMLVSHVVILHRAAYVGSEVATVAGITAVGTHPYYQKRGYGTRVVQDTLRIVRQRAYDLAMLTTRLPSFFARFGFREVPKVDGHACPISALTRLEVAHPCSVEKLDYLRHWPAMAAIYHQYSQGRTGMQVRDLRLWETWPRRGTFPYGFTSQLDAMGLMAMVGDQHVAYLAGHTPPGEKRIVVTELGHLRGHEDAALTMLRDLAQRSQEVGVTRAVLQMGGGTPVLKRLEEQRVPVQLEVGPGLMVLFPNTEWLRPAGLRSPDEAVEHLFRSPIPVLWHRDGY
jgi:predicted N-acetyltransferase YhbS